MWILSQWKHCLKLVDFLALWHLGREIFWGQRACLCILRHTTKREFSLISTLLLFLLHFPIWLTFFMLLISQLSFDPGRIRDKLPAAPFLGFFVPLLCLSHVFISPFLFWGFPLPPCILLHRPHVQLRLVGEVAIVTALTGHYSPGTQWWTSFLSCVSFQRPGAVQVRVSEEWNEGRQRNRLRIGSWG